MRDTSEMSLNEMKQLMCDVGRWIWQRGFCAGNEGNHSLRLSENRVLCTPSGISKGMLDPEDLCVVDYEGNLIEPNARGRKRTSEILVHLAIYKQRSDVQAVIHSHPPHAVAFCIADIPLPEGIHPEAEVFLGKVPYARYATPGTEKLPESILPLIGPETNTVLMGNHGSVNVGRDLVEAYYRLEILDNYCKQLILAKQLGHVNVLNPQEMSELLEVKQKFGFSDERTTCAAHGCVGTQNQPFIAGFDVRPSSAQCSCNGGEVAHTQPAPQPPAGAPTHDDSYEQLVQTLTDQIMAGIR